MMRILLFLATNIAVLVLLSIVLFIVQGVFGMRLGNYSGLLVMAAVFGFGGSFISLAMSKWMAKRTTGAQVITQPRSEAERWLLDTVRERGAKGRHRHARGRRLRRAGDECLRHRHEPQQCAGRRQHRPAASMDRDEVEAVLGHEISHVANGDMVTMALDPGRAQHLRDLPRAGHRRVIDNALSGDRDNEGTVAASATSSS